jgi:predicted MFS family arabinose efflux permease
LWIAYAHDLPVLLGAAALFGVAQGITYPTMHAYLIDLAAEAQLGRSQALFNGAFHLGVGCSALAFGMVAEQFGYRAMFVAAAAMPLLGALVFAIGTARTAAVARR